MQFSKIVPLALSSLLNAVMCFASFWLAVLATSPEMQDVTMRAGYYVMHAIAAVAFVGIVGPWILEYQAHRKRAIILAALPTMLVCIAILAFLLLDSWLQRNFSS